MKEIDIPTPEANENIVKIVNYSPNKHLKACSYEQKINNKTCYQQKECLSWGEDGCWSSEALAPEIGAHYLGHKNPKDVVKSRCFFLVSKHPNKKLYFSGVIFITNSCEADSESNDKGWVVGEPIPFEPQTVEWRGKLKRGGAEKWISNKEALEILEAYYSKVKDKKVAEIIKFYKKGEIPDFVTDLRPCPPLEYYSDNRNIVEIIHYDFDLLSTKKQIILYGPPGTGKTYQAKKTATNFILGRVYTMNFEEKFQELKEKGKIEFVTFHPTYSYEEFVEGYRPQKNGNFDVEDGIFKKICKRAFYDLCKAAEIPVKSGDENGDEIENTWKEYFGENKNGLSEEYIKKIQKAMKSNSIKKYVLIIDEINRGNISKILGELITLLEPDKRIGGKYYTPVTLPYSKQKFGVPPNLYIIGTMNTADRSIALVDIALRRRFGFIEIPPEPKKIYEVVNDELGLSKKEITEKLGGLDLEKLLKAMNMRITFYADREKQIGHAYFLNIFRNENGEYVDEPEPWKENLHRIWYNEIIPLLQEYFYNDYEKIKKVLGEAGDVFIEEIKRDEDDILKKDEDFEDIKRYKIKYLKNAEELIEALKKV